MLMATRFKERVNSKNKRIQRRFWALYFVASLMFTGLVWFVLRYSEYIKASGTLELQFKVLLIIGLIINASILLINYLISLDD